MLQSFDYTTGRRNQSAYRDKWEGLNGHNNRRMKCDARRENNIRAFPGNHRLAAIVALIRGRAWHRATTLHALGV
jgi:hypothetical protein